MTDSIAAIPCRQTPQLQTSGSGASPASGGAASFKAPKSYLGRMISYFTKGAGSRKTGLALEGIRSAKLADIRPSTLGFAPQEEDEEEDCYDDYYGDEPYWVVDLNVTEDDYLKILDDMILEARRPELREKEKRIADQKHTAVEGKGVGNDRTASDKFCKTYDINRNNDRKSQADIDKEMAALSKNIAELKKVVLPVPLVPLSVIITGPGPFGAAPNQTFGKKPDLTNDVVESKDLLGAYNVASKNAEIKIKALKENCAYRIDKNDEGSDESKLENQIITDFYNSIVSIENGMKNINSEIRRYPLSYSNFGLNEVEKAEGLKKLIDAGWQRLKGSTGSIRYVEKALGKLDTKVASTAAQPAVLVA